MTYGAMKINYDDPVYNAYKDGEPDYADGDLEDKLGDSGYYYDLFPEERDGEPDDYQSSKSNNNSKKSTNYDSNFSITDDYIRNMKNINTRKFYRVYGAVNINGNTYYRNQDDTYYRGWKEENGSWYYFDEITYVLVRNGLKNIDGIVYYFNEYGQMESNKTINIAGYNVAIDENGSCRIVD